MRLIDADALKERIMGWLKPQKADEGTFVDLAEISIAVMQTIDEIQTEDRPHGEWVQVTAKDGEYYCYHKCTNCGQTIESGFDNPPIFNFCPNCGADMREGDRNG